MYLTAEQKVKKLIILKAIEFGYHHIGDFSDIDQCWDEVTADENSYWDALYEAREGDFETDIECEYSRHYESKSVAAQCEDGSWVGWTYWFGGGKHGEPEGIDWIDRAYDIVCKEEEKLVIVREFSKAK